MAVWRVCGGFGAWVGGQEREEGGRNRARHFLSLDSETKFNVQCRVNKLQHCSLACFSRPAASAAGTTAAEECCPIGWLLPPSTPPLPWLPKVAATTPTPFLNV